MRVIDLDATHWKSAMDFYSDLLKSLTAPDWHGSSVAALVDSMIWGGINEIEPPYTVRILGISKAPHDVKDEIEAVQKALIRARAEYQDRKGHGIEVNFEIYR